MLAFLSASPQRAAPSSCRAFHSSSHGAQQPSMELGNNRARLNQIPKRAKHWAHENHGISDWHLPSTSALETPTFSPPILIMKWCHFVFVVVTAAASIQVLLHVFVYLLFFPFLAVLIFAICSIPATCESKGAENCSAKWTKCFKWVLIISLHWTLDYSYAEKITKIKAS